jgi:polyisoprenyl-phosphate glycosyltransferase
VSPARPTLSIVCPMYDEALSLPAFEERLTAVLSGTGQSFEVVCVNDGSRDNTLHLLRAWRARDPRVRVIDLTRNFGKEAALTCGIDHARGEAVIPIDADLQDPRRTAAWFYRLHNRIADAPIPVNVGDFRLLDRQVIDALARLPERRRFMKGLFAWVGFRQATLPYTRAARQHGQTKFSGWRLWNFALDGITSFSTAPLRMWTYIGLAVALLAFLYGLIIIAQVLITGRDLPGYASLITVVLFLGGVQLIGLGMLGEYVGRLHQEVKQRPIYLVRQDATDAP